jgi:phosphoglycolate phosphatase
MPLAIFDIDGTLVDSRFVISSTMAEAFEAKGLAPPAYEQTRKIVGLSLMEAIDRLAPDGLSHEDLLALTEAYKNAFIARRQSGTLHEPLYSGAVEVLDALKSAGWDIGAATGKSRRGLDAIIMTHGFDRYFDCHFCADDGPGKPHPFMVEANLKARAFAPRDAVMIGDTSFDMLMAKAAGAAAFGVDWGFHTPAEISAGGADSLYSDMAGLQAGLLEFGQRRAA